MYFKLFQCCMPVKGKRRGLICDVQRGNLHLIPIALYEILVSHRGKSLEEVKAYFSNENEEVIDEYFAFLIANELGFWCREEDLELFPEMSLDWKTPFLITNAVIDVAQDNAFDFSGIVRQLAEVSCPTVQLRFFSSIWIHQLENILSSFDGSSVRCIYLLIKHNQDWDKNYYANLIEKYPRLETIEVHQYAVDGEMYYNDKRIGFYKKAMPSEICCGAVSTKHFSSNLRLFTESQHYNSCLHRKISIDINGNIKNCPSMKESYGNIEGTRLLEALEKPGFKKYWSINKDQVSVCKDCEFRYICTDCRAYLEDPQDSYSKPLKCGYDPYTCEWEEWSTNPLKQEAIEHYGMRELVKSEP